MTIPGVGLITAHAITITGTFYAQFRLVDMDYNIRPTALVMIKIEIHLNRSAYYV